MKDYSKENPRVLQRDVYDTIELVAYAFGGIGSRVWFASGPNFAIDVNCPVCVHGLATFAEQEEPYINGVPDNGVELDAGELYRALKDADIGTGDNDMAVRAINQRQGGDLQARVTFEEWCAELFVVRGDN